MICEKCGKRSATVHFTKVIHGKKTEWHMCESCAREKGERERPFEGGFPLHQFFSGMMGFMPAGSSDNLLLQAQTGVQCSCCGLTYAQFGQIGRFGCENCYEAFADCLPALFRRLHGSQKHRGKVPLRTETGVKLKRDIALLREELQRKIAEEAFEEAAALRDRIKELEQEREAGGAAGEGKG